MDKRILKTKKALKEALFGLLQKQNFDSITTTQICETAMISRNTFYNYYADKYALLEDIFKGYEDRFEEAFEAVQQQNNPSQEMKKSFLNLIDTFLALDSLPQSISLLSSFDLMALYYRALMNILEKYESRYATMINPDYDLQQLNSFLVLGFWGYIHGDQKLDRAAVQERSRRLVLDLLDSPIFR